MSAQRMCCKALKVLVLCAMAACSVQGASLFAQYDITFSIFGKIGEAQVSYHEEGDLYHIHIEGGLTGTAASIGQHRREIHDSYGRIEKGVLVPELYKKVRLSDHRNEETYYVYDYENSVIQQHRIRTKEQMKHHFDIAQMRFIETPEVIIKRSVKTLPYFARNDLLSLFFNVRTFLCDISRGEEKIAHTAGARNDKGEVIISNPAGKKRRELAVLMPKNSDRFISVVIDQDIFKSDRGELHISLDEDFLVHEALLKDVLLFGDIHGYRVWQRGTLKNR